MPWVPFPGSGPSIGVGPYEGTADVSAVVGATAVGGRPDFVQSFGEPDARRCFCSVPTPSPARHEFKIGGTNEFGLAAGEYMSFCVPVFPGPRGSGYFYSIGASSVALEAALVETPVETFARKAFYRLESVPFAPSMTSARLLDYVDGPIVRTTRADEEFGILDTGVFDFGGRHQPPFFGVALEIWGRSAKRNLSLMELLATPEGQSLRWGCIRSRWTSMRLHLTDFVKALRMIWSNPRSSFEGGYARNMDDELVRVAADNPVPQLHPASGDWEDDSAIVLLSPVFAGRESISLRDPATLASMQAVFGTSASRTWERNWQNILGRRTNWRISALQEAVRDLLTAREDTLAREDVCLTGTLSAESPARVVPRTEVRLSIERLTGTDPYLWTEI